MSLRVKAIGRDEPLAFMCVDSVWPLPQARMGRVCVTSEVRWGSPRPKDRGGLMRCAEDRPVRPHCSAGEGTAR